jgi:hypothetical protein
MQNASQNSVFTSSHKKKTKWDFRVEYHGAILLLVPLSHHGLRWVERCIGADNGYQTLLPNSRNRTALHGRRSSRYPQAGLDGAMSDTSSVVFHVPDFVDADGIAYTDIEVIVEMDSDIRSTSKIAQTLERPIETECK